MKRIDNDKAGGKVLVATEVRIYRVEGKIYASSSFAKTIERYSKCFGEIVLASRVISAKKIRDGFLPIDSYCTEVLNVGSLAGFLFGRVPSRIKRYFDKSELVVLRMPSIVSIRAYRLVKKYHKKYMTEVVGCAWGAYWNHDVVGKVIAPLVFLITKRIIKKADYCLYVTNEFLQRRYPNNGMSVGVSDVDIPCVGRPKKYNSLGNNITMMTAAAIDVKYKGQKYVIKAIGTLKKKYGIDAVYCLAGSGSNLRLKKLAKKEGVSDNVVFLGMLSHDELFERMRKVDLYIQPSLSEGLPRSLVEAMSCGTICLGSDVGGIPELLDAQHIFRKKSKQAIVESVLSVCKSNKLEEASKRNIEESRKYLMGVLDEKRMAFLDKVKEEVFKTGDKKSKYKITLVNNKLIGGGAERVTCNLANYLCREGYEVDIVTISDKGGSYRLDDRVGRFCALSGSEDVGKLRRFYISLKRIKQYVLRHQEVACYITMMPMNAFMLTRLRKLTSAKIIVAERNDPASSALRERLMTQYAVRRCDGLVVQTSAIGEWYKDVRRKVVIPNAINNDVVFPMRNSIKKKFVAVARLEKQKNYPLLIEAFSKFSKIHPEYTLEIYGQGTQEENIKDLIKKYGLKDKIKLNGYVTNIPNHIADAECFVLSSDYEGMPNALIEAMCIGLPCISTDCAGGGARDLIEDGENGLLIERGDVDGLVAAMVKMAEDDGLRLKVSEEAKKMRQKLDGEKIYREWLDFIRRIVEGKKK